MNLAKLSLMLVVLVDVMGQGLAFPIFNALMMQADLGFLPAGTAEAARRFNYGLVISVFFITWFSALSMSAGFPTVSAARRV